MTERKWSVREYRAEDLDAVRELFTVVFHKSRPREHFSWKFHDNPAGKGIIVVAEDRAKIVGQYALMPTRLRLGSEVVLGAQSLDTMTHPDYRNQGMFVALAKECMARAAALGVDALYGFPNESSYHGFVGRLNWDHTGDIPRLIRFLNLNSTEVAPLTRHLLSVGLPLWPMGKEAPSGFEVRMEKPSENEWTSVADSGADTTCRVERSLDWFRWRFDAASQREYVWFSAYSSGKLRAYAVYGMNNWGERPILDVVGTDGAALEAVASAATRHAKRQGIGSLIAFSNDAGVCRALKSCGYLQRRSIPLITRSMTPRTLGGNIHDHGSWRIYSEDVDGF